MDSAVIFLRVSTDEQDEQNQHEACAKLCAREGWPVVEVIRCRATGTKLQPEHTAAMAGAAEKRWTRIVCWALDRWSRRGPEVVLSDVRRIDELGGVLVSVQEPFTAITDPMVRKYLLMSFAWVAEWEARRRKERTREGMRESKRKLAEKGSYRRMRNGVVVEVTHVGRARREPSPAALAIARAARDSGASWAKVASEVWERTGKAHHPVTLRGYVLGGKVAP